MAGPGGFLVNGGQPAPDPKPPSTDGYEAGPRAAGGDEGGWPTNHLSASRFQAWASDGWTGVPREQASASQRPASPVWGPPAAPPPQRSDGHHGAAPPQAAPPPPSRGPLAFHLDVGAGSALAAAPPASPPPSPPVTPFAVAPQSGPGRADPPDGGRGWGIRQHRQFPGSSVTAPAPAVPAAPARPPAARSVQAYAIPPAPWEDPPKRRGRPVLTALVMLVLAALVVGGVVLYLSGGLNQGLGSGTHTLAVPAALGGLAEDSSPHLQAAEQTLQAGVEGADRTPHVLLQMVTAFYAPPAPGGGGIATPEYYLFMSSYDAALTSTDRTALGTLITAGTIQTVNGISFHCGTPTGGSMSSLCFWIDGNVMGVVEGAAVVGPASTLAAAEEARAAGES